MWICDGRRLHRYDPTTLQPVATVDLDIECEEVYATDDLVVAYRTNEDPASPAPRPPRSSTRPATRSWRRWPARRRGLSSRARRRRVLPRHRRPAAVVVDRATWTVSATPDLGRPTRVGLTATDGDRIYAPVAGYRDVVVIDAATFEVVDTIDTLGNAAPVLVDGSLWTADSWYGLMQRHDLG